MGLVASLQYPLGSFQIGLVCFRSLSLFNGMQACLHWQSEMAATLEKVSLHLLSKRSGGDLLTHLGDGRLSQSRQQGIPGEAPRPVIHKPAADAYLANRQLAAVDSSLHEPSRPSSRQFVAQGSFGTWGRRESQQGSAQQTGGGAAAAASSVPEVHPPAAQADDFGLLPSGSKHLDHEDFPIILWPKVSAPTFTTSEAAAAFPPLRPISAAISGPPPPDIAHQGLLLSGLVPTSPATSDASTASRRGELTDSFVQRRRSSGLFGRSTVVSLQSQELPSPAAQGLPPPAARELPSPAAAQEPPLPASASYASSHGGGLRHLPSLPPRGSRAPTVNPGLWLNPAGVDTSRARSMTALSPNRLHTGRTGSNPLLPPMTASHNVIIANLAANHKSAWESMGRKWFTRQEESTGSSSNDGAGGVGDALAPVPERQ